MTSSQRNLATCLLAGGGGLAYMSQVTQSALPVGQRLVAVLLMVAGSVIFLGGILTARDERIFLWLDDKLKKPSLWLNIATWQIVLLPISILLVLLTHFAAGVDDKMASPLVAWYSWLYGIGACVLGSWGAVNIDLRSKWKWFAIALGLSVIALPVRSIAANYIPIILNGDEASAGLYGIAFLEGRANNVFSAGWYSFPGLYFLIPAASVSILGNTTAALRVPSAIAGALTVGGVYLTGHAMFSKRTGLIAALAMIGFHFHVHFSRIGLNNIWDGLFFSITVGAAWYAWEKESRLAYILTGLGLGLSQYFYPSSRILLAVVFGGILLNGLFRFSYLKRSLANISLMTWVMIVTVLPLGLYYARFPEQYFAPLNRVSIFGAWLENEIQISELPAWQILLKQLWLGFQAFTYLPLQHWYRPQTALLRPMYAGFFILGLLFLISRPKESRSMFLFIWLGMYIFIGGLSESTPAAQRYVAAAPACVLLLAVGLDETAQLFQRLWQRSERVFTIVLITTALLLTVDDLNFYFNVYTPRTVDDFGLDNNVVAQELANEFKSKPEGTQAFFMSNSNMGYYSIPSIAYLAPQVQGFDVSYPWGSTENPVPTSDHFIFIFHPSNITDMQSVQNTYPNGVLKEKLGINGEPLYWTYEVGASQ